jgi:hypothetical protein
MKLFDPALNLSATQKTLRLILGFFLFAVIFIGFPPSMFISFSPAKAMKLPFLITSSLVSLLIFGLAVFEYKKRFNDRQRNQFYGNKPVTVLVTMGFIYCLVIGLLLFSSLSVTTSATLTKLLGAPYKIEDIVTKTDECHSRGCSFCNKRVWLKNHEQGDLNYFCPTDSEWPYLKAGNKVLVVGSKSILGVQIESFQELKPIANNTTPNHTP